MTASGVSLALTAIGSSDAFDLFFFLVVIVPPITKILTIANIIVDQVPDRCNL
jgi:hypothetical protein